MLQIIAVAAWLLCEQNKSTSKWNVVPLFWNISAVPNELSLPWLLPPSPSFSSSASKGFGVVCRKESSPAAASSRPPGGIGGVGDVDDVAGAEAHLVIFFGAEVVQSQNLLRRRLRLLLENTHIACCYANRWAVCWSDLGKVGAVRSLSCTGRASSFWLDDTLHALLRATPPGLQNTKTQCLTFDLHIQKFDCTSDKWSSSLKLDLQVTILIPES